MEQLDVEQIAKNVASQLADLRLQKEKIETQMKSRLAVINAQLSTLEKLAGIRKTPGKGGNKTPSPLIAIAKRVLEASQNGILSSTQITDIAIEQEIWENPPKSAKANMARVLKVASSDPTTGILCDKDGDYYLKEEDFG